MGGYQPFPHGNPAADVLRDKIRNAREPNNPALLGVWFDFEDASIGTGGVEHRWQLYVAEFHLLLDTFADEVLPRHWRSLCLDNVFRPLAELNRIADDGRRHSELKQLMRELAATSHFFCPA